MYRGGCAFELLLLELAARQHRFFGGGTPATPNSPVHFWSPRQGTFLLRTTQKVGPSFGAAAVPH